MNDLKGINFPEGYVAVIDKPLEWTSTDVVRKIKFRLNRMGYRKIKVGHAGTLDPLATGVLVLCTGAMTKQIERLQSHTKEYVATLQFGATTASYDREHTVNHTFPKHHVTRERILSALPQFIGDISQVPPTYSAVKVNGDRAYELRRAGEDVVLKAKTVHVDEIEILDFDEEKKHLAIRVVCGKGTYIRALARDLGRAVGSGAFLTSLRRTRVGDIGVADCVDFDHVGEWIERQAGLPSETGTRENIKA